MTRPRNELTGAPTDFFLLLTVGAAVVILQFWTTVLRDVEKRLPERPVPLGLAPWQDPSIFDDAEGRN